MIFKIDLDVGAQSVGLFGAQKSFAAVATEVKDVLSTLEKRCAVAALLARKLFCNFRAATR